MCGRHLKIFDIWHLTFCHRIVKTVPPDLDILFKVKSENFYISETVWASTKIHQMTFFKDLDICQRMIPLRKLDIMIFTYFSNSKIWNFNISETVRASATWEMTLSTWHFFNVSQATNFPMLLCTILIACRCLLISSPTFWD